MRPLTDDERRRLETRRQKFDAFFEEIMPVLADFAERLGRQDSAMIAADPEQFLGPIDAFMTHQTIGEEDRVWILTRLGYFIGELLAKRLCGCWLVNEIPDTPSFLRYVVGNFVRAPNHNAIVDPFEAADRFLAHPPGRRLAKWVSELEEEILRFRAEGQGPRAWP